MNTLTERQQVRLLSNQTDNAEPGKDKEKKTLKRKASKKDLSQEEPVVKRKVPRKVSTKIKSKDKTEDATVAPEKEGKRSRAKRSGTITKRVAKKSSSSVRSAYNCYLEARVGELRAASLKDGGVISVDGHRALFGQAAREWREMDAASKEPYEIIAKQPRKSKPATAQERKGLTKARCSLCKKGGEGVLTCISCQSPYHISCLKEGGEGAAEKACWCCPQCENTHMAIIKKKATNGEGGDGVRGVQISETSESSSDDGDSSAPSSPRPSLPAASKEQIKRDGMPGSVSTDVARSEETPNSCSAVSKPVVSEAPAVAVGTNSRPKLALKKLLSQRVQTDNTSLSTVTSPKKMFKERLSSLEAGGSNAFQSGTNGGINDSKVEPVAAAAAGGDTNGGIDKCKLETVEGVVDQLIPPPPPPLPKHMQQQLNGNGEGKRAREVEHDMIPPPPPPRRPSSVQQPSNGVSAPLRKEEYKHDGRASNEDVDMLAAADLLLQRRDLLSSPLSVPRGRSWVQGKDNSLSIPKVGLTTGKVSGGAVDDEFDGGATIKREASVISSQELGSRREPSPPPERAYRREDDIIWRGDGAGGGGIDRRHSGSSDIRNPHVYKNHSSNGSFGDYHRAAGTVGGNGVRISESRGPSQSQRHDQARKYDRDFGARALPPRTERSGFERQADSRDRVYYRDSDRGFQRDRRDGNRDRY